MRLAVRRLSPTPRRVAERHAVCRRPLRTWRNRSTRASRYRFARTIAACRLAERLEQLLPLVDELIAAVAHVFESGNATHRGRQGSHGV